jgi:hypothetical protein
MSEVLPTKDGKQLLAGGSQLKGELVKFDTKTGQLVPVLGGISAGSRRSTHSTLIFRRIVIASDWLGWTALAPRRGTPFLNSSYCRQYPKLRRQAEGAVQNLDCHPTWLEYDRKPS